MSCGSGRSGGDPDRIIDELRKKLDEINKALLNRRFRSDFDSDEANRDFVLEVEMILERP